MSSGNETATGHDSSWKRDCSRSVDVNMQLVRGTRLELAEGEQNTFACGSDAAITTYSVLFNITNRSGGWILSNKYSKMKTATFTITQFGVQLDACQLQMFKFHCKHLAVLFAGKLSAFNVRETDTRCYLDYKQYSHTRMSARVRTRRSSRQFVSSLQHLCDLQTIV
jgi:hypothetical protein